MADHNSPDSSEEWGDEADATDAAEGLAAAVVFMEENDSEEEPYPEQKEDHMVRQAMEGAANLPPNDYRPDMEEARPSRPPRGTGTKLKAVLNYAIIAVVLAAALVATYIVSASSTTVSQAEEQQKDNQPGTNEESGGKENSSAPPPAPASPAETAPVATETGITDQPAPPVAAAAPAATAAEAPAASTAAVASDQAKPEDTNADSQAARLPEVSAGEWATMADLGDFSAREVFLLDTGPDNLLPPGFLETPGTRMNIEYMLAPNALRKLPQLGGKLVGGVLINWLPQPHEGSAPMRVISLQVSTNPRQASLPPDQQQIWFVINATRSSRSVEITADQVMATLWERPQLGR